MNPLVTIAIAAYNVENYLDNGLKSIINQTYSNLEIIIVDDGSTDNTPKLCDSYAKRDARFRVFHKNNGGLGSARNIGIENANGEFLFFFDVDDSIESTFIEDSVKIAIENSVDLIIYGYFARYSNSNIEETILLTERRIHSNDELKKAYIEELLWMKHGNGFAWNKFYRMSFLKKYNFRFGDQLIQQDEPFNLQLYPKLDNVYISNKAYYHYVLYVNANAGARYVDKKEDIITNVYMKFIDFYDSWEICDENVLRYIQNRFLTDLFYVATLNYYHPKCALTFNEKRIRIKRILESDNVIKVLQKQKVRYGNNIINNVQVFAFNIRNTSLLMLSTTVKNFLKRIVRR